MVWNRARRPALANEMRRVHVSERLVANESRFIESLHDFPDGKHFADVLRRDHIYVGIDSSPHIHIQSSFYDVGSEKHMVLVISPDGLVPESIDLLYELA